MCSGEWETQCANPIWSYQTPEFHFSGYSMCTSIVRKCSLKLFSDFSQLFNLLHDHSAVTRSLDSFLELYRKQRVGPYLSVICVSCLVDCYYCQEFLSHLFCSRVQMSSPLAEIYCDFLWDLKKPVSIWLMQYICSDTQPQSVK